MKDAKTLTLICIVISAISLHAQKPPSIDYFDCAMPSQATAFISTGSSFLYRTTDFGRNWKKLNTPSSLYFIDFADSLVGYGTKMNDSILWKTTDGGGTWNSISQFSYHIVSASLGELCGFEFIDAKHGFVFGYGGIHRTSDGGETWTDISDQLTVGIDKYYPFYQIAFIDSLNGLALNSYHGLNGTTDGGVTWSLKSVHVPDYPMYRLTARGSSGYAMIGFKQPGGGKWESWLDIGSADGNIWTREYYNIDIPPKEVSPLEIGYFDAVYGVAFTNTGASSTGKTLLTSDSGRTWRQGYFPTTLAATACGLHSSGYGYVVGEIETRVAKTTDYGVTWWQIDAGAVDVEEMPVSNACSVFLGQSYPNPAVAEQRQTVVPYSLSTSSHVRIEIRDMMGREVRTIVDADRSPGSYTERLDVSALTPGVYLISMFAGSNPPMVRRMVVR